MNYQSPTTQPGSAWNEVSYNVYDDTQRLNGGSWLANSVSVPSTNHQTAQPLHARSWSDDRKRPTSSAGSFADLKGYVLRFCPSLDALPFWTSSRRGTLTQSGPASSLPPALPSPTTVKFILLCSLWYTSSAMSSNTGKTILNQFRYPVTLTLVQFAFVASYCLLFMSPIIRFARLRRPTRAILNSTLPMGMFQVGGHMFSSMAISRIPVSTVHTIKALSPLFTVAAYALLFRVSYSTQTYISLLPLTIGVMLACTFDMTASSAIGFLCAFGSALVFVSSNIFFKKIMPSGSTQTSSHKLDKLNLLLYSSGMAFLLMIPIWLYTDLPALLSTAQETGGHVYAGHPSKGHDAPHSVTYYFFMNGTVHFAQNIIAFIILSSTSPVTYSIASLIKRVVVICIAIVWFSQTVHPVQGVGIVMTFLGLWMYNNAKSDVEKGENKMRRVEAARELMLPTSMKEEGEKGTQLEVNVIAPPPYGRTRARTIMAPVQQQQHHLPEPPASARVTSFAPVNGHVHHHDHNHHHHQPNLHLKIVPSAFNAQVASKNMQGVTSPTDSYPSPPPSLDSPPSSPPPLGYGHQHPIAVQ